MIKFRVYRLVPTDMLEEMMETKIKDNRHLQEQINKRWIFIDSCIDNNQRRIYIKYIVHHNQIIEVQTDEVSRMNQELNYRKNNIVL